MGLAYRKRKHRAEEERTSQTNRERKSWEHGESKRERSKCDLRELQDIIFLQHLPHGQPDFNWYADVFLYRASIDF